MILTNINKVQFVYNIITTKTLSVAPRIKWLHKKKLKQFI